MPDYNGLMNSRFRGCPLLLEKEDSRGWKLQAFYIDDPELIGIVHGPDAWIAQASGCLHDTNIIKSLREYDIQQHPERQPLRRVPLNKEPV